MTSTVSQAPPTSARTDLVTMLLGTWLMIGIFLDGYAHTSLIEELESFFTPWHAVFYSGFLATSGWVVWTIYRNMKRGYRAREAIPPGYGPTVFGLALFGLGGVGDGIWHTIYGIEQGVDALLSPTHFMLFVGGLLGLSTVIRTARVRNPGTDLAPTDQIPLMLSLLLVTAALAFFAVYMWVPAQPWAMGIPFEDASGAVGLVIGGLLVATTVLLSPALMVFRWWRPPPGTFALIWPVVNGALALAFSLDLGVAISFGVAGGAVGEVLTRLLRPGPEERTASLVTLSIVPVAAWSAALVVFEIGDDILWPPEVWMGSIVLCGLAAAGLSWIALPDPKRGPAPV